MKSNAIMGTVEVIGEISDLKVKDEYLVMNIRTTVPVGWNFRAALSHADIWRMAKLMFKPGNLLYLIFGFGKPGDKQRVPEY
jgi:hypothetical protein